MFGRPTLAQRQSGVLVRLLLDHGMEKMGILVLGNAFNGRCSVQAARCVRRISVLSQEGDALAALGRFEDANLAYTRAIENLDRPIYLGNKLS